MKSIKEMSQFEVAAYVQSYLERHRIYVVLSGGAATGYYSQKNYISKDIDLVNEYQIGRKKIETAMNEIGFFEQGRYFNNPESMFGVEFPPGPLSVGLRTCKDHR